MAALYDPRYDYPSAQRQSSIGSMGGLDKRNHYLRKLYPDTVGPAPALSNTGSRSSDNTIPDSFFADPMLALMAGGNKGEASLAETRAYFESLHPAVQKQHAARIDGSHTAALEMRDAMGPPPMYGNLDGTVTAGAGDQNESGDPVDELQELYAAQNNAQSNPDRSYRDMSQGAQDARGALASVNTSTSGELPVLASVPDRSGSNSLTNLLSGLTYDAIGYFTGTSAEDVRANGISVIHNGKEIFAVDGLGNTAPITPEQAAAIQAENSGGGEQQQNPPMGMSFNPPVPALTSPSTETGTGTGALTVKGSQNAQQPVNRVRASTGGYTGNARGSGLPDMQIGLGERLMRMGMAGLANASQGSLAQMGAMTGAYNDVNQANRQAEMDTFKIEEERRQAHADRVAALAASKNKGAGDATDFSSMASSLTEMEGLYAMLGQENLTGPLMGTVGKWAEGAGLFDFFRDKPKDAMKAYARFQLQGLKVDDTLLRVAQTKGAISDAEMKLFQSDTPSMTDSEGVWQNYLNERMVVLRKALAAQGYALNAPVKVGGATITPIAD